MGRSLSLQKHNDKEPRYKLVLRVYDGYERPDYYTLYWFYSNDIGEDENGNFFIKQGIFEKLSIRDSFNEHVRYPFNFYIKYFPIGKYFKEFNFWPDDKWAINYSTISFLNKGDAFKFKLLFSEHIGAEWHKYSLSENKESK